MPLQLERAGPRLSLRKGNPSKFAAYSADFTSGVYGRRKTSLTAAQAAANTNTSGFVGPNTGGTFRVISSANAIRRGSAGAYCEPAATNLCGQPRDLSNAFWNIAGNRTVGEASVFGDALAFRYVETTSGSLARWNNTVAVSVGVQHTLSAIVSAANFTWLRFSIGDTATPGTNSHRIWFNLATGAAGSQVAAGTGYGFNSHSIETLAAGVYRIRITFTAPVGTFSMLWCSADADGSTTRANIGGGVGVGPALTFHHCQLETGGVASSPILTGTTRAADQIVLKLPSGAHALTVTFDDNSTQSFVGASGDYALNPAVLNRRIIRSIRSTGLVFGGLVKRYLVADYVEGNPTWTDNTAGLQEMLDDLVAGGGGTVSAPAGSYGFDGTVSVTGAALPSMTLNMPGVEFVFTHAPSSYSIRIDRTGASAGQKLTINGLEARLNRVPIRTSDSDLFELDGFADYEITNPEVGSADNMGIAIGRRTASSGRIVNSLVILSPKVGTFSHPDNQTTAGCYGRVGDTGIYILTPGLSTLISGGEFRCTGDDALYIGNNAAGTIGAGLRITVQNNVFEDVFQAFGTMFDNVDFKLNTIRRTGAHGARYYVDSVYSSNVADGCVGEDNLYEDIGLRTLAQGDAFQQIGSGLVHGAVWVRGTNHTERRPTIRRTLNNAIRLEAPNVAVANLTGLRVIDPVFEDIGYQDGALLAYNAGRAIITSVTGTSSVGLIQDVQITGATIDRTNQPLFAWSPLDRVDGTALIPLLFEVTSLRNWGGGSSALVSVAASGTGRAYWQVNVACGAGQATPATPKSVSGGASNAADVEVNLVAANTNLTPAQVSTMFRLKNAARRSGVANPVTGSEMGSPPTITQLASHDAAFSVRANWVDTPSLMRASGGNRYGRTTTKGLHVATSNLSPSSSGNLTAFTNLSPALVNGGEHQLCYTVEFVALAQVVELELRSPGGNNPYRIIVDDAFVARDGLANTAQFVKLDFGTRASRRITVEVGVAQSFLGVSVISGDTITAPTDDVIRIAGTGDSHTEATTAGVEETTPYRPWDGWLSAFGKRIGSRSVRNSAVGGTGYWNSNGGARLKIAGQMDYWALSPNVYDLIAFAGGYNDAGQVTTTVLRAEARAAWEKARLNQPGALIVVLGIFGQATGPSANILAAENALKAEFDVWADPFSMWIPVSTDPGGAWITGTGRVGATNGTGNSDIYVSSDGIHPSRAGRLWAAEKADGAYRTKLAAM